MQRASAGLLLTHLNFCRSEGQQGKLSNGLGSVQSEGVMTETLAGVPFSTFLPLPGLFNHFTCSSASPQCRQNAAELFLFEEELYSEPFFHSFLFPFFCHSSQSWFLFSTRRWLGKRLPISSKSHAYPTFWNINKEFQIEDRCFLLFLQQLLWPFSYLHSCVDPAKGISSVIGSGTSCRFC